MACVSQGRGGGGKGNPAPLKPPNTCSNSGSPSSGVTGQLEGLAALSHVVDMAATTGLGAVLMVGSPIAVGATCVYSGGLLCFAAIEAAPAGMIGGYYLMKASAHELADLWRKNGC